MAEFRATYIGHSMEHSWGVERLADGQTEILPQRYSTQKDAQDEAVRLANLHADGGDA